MQLKIVIYVVLAGLLVLPAKANDEQAIGDAVANAAEFYDIDPCLIDAVIEVESNRQHVRNGKVKRGAAGEIGIAQILPDGMKIKQDYDLYLLEDNLLCCAELLRFALDERTDGDVRLALQWYNGGPGMHSDAARRYAKKVMTIYKDLKEEDA